MGIPQLRVLRIGAAWSPYEAWDALYSALTTLPALESLTLAYRESERDEQESDLADPESLGRLLRVPSLRSVCFYQFYFTHALWQSTVNAFMEGSAVTKLEINDCSRPSANVDWSPFFWLWKRMRGSRP
jgi:hypothetical protein